MIAVVFKCTYWHVWCIIVRSCSNRCLKSVLRALIEFWSPGCLKSYPIRCWSASSFCCFYFTRSIEVVTCCLIVSNSSVTASARVPIAFFSREIWLSTAVILYVSSVAEGDTSRCYNSLTASCSSRIFSRRPRLDLVFCKELAVADI